MTQAQIAQIGFAARSCDNALDARSQADFVPTFHAFPRSRSLRVVPALGARRELPGAAGHSRLAGPNVAATASPEREDA